VADFMKTYEVPGLGIAIVQEGGLVYDERSVLPTSRPNNLNPTQSLSNREHLQADHLRSYLQADKTGKLALTIACSGPSGILAERPRP